MYVKVTRSGTRRYVQLVEAFRDASGRAKQRTVASLGRLEQVQGNLDSVINGLRRVAGKEPLPPDDEVFAFSPARALGDLWALDALWRELGFHRLNDCFRRQRYEIDIEALTRIMVFNRLCDPESKLGVLRWLETVSFPGLTLASVDHQHLLRTMDALVDHQDAVENAIHGLLRPLVDQELSVVFYDMTTIRAEGASEAEGDVRRYGLSKLGRIERQFMLGAVQTADGLPIYHEVFDGNTAEVTTLIPVIEKLTRRYPVRRLVVVADRGLLSTDNLAELEALTLPDGEPLEFILAVPGRRYRDFNPTVTDYHQRHCASASTEVTGEVQWGKHRLVIAYDPETARQQSESRDQKIAELEAHAKNWCGKLDSQDEGKRSRGRELSDGGARARFYHAVKEARLASIIRVDLKSELFSYSIDQQALQHARLMDGKLLLVTNVKDLTPEAIVTRYKSLADIERGFRVLKSELEIGPVYHRLPKRIKAHALICFIALILYRVMRQRLQTSHTGLSPERALSVLSRVQYHQLNREGQPWIQGVSTITPEQGELFSCLGAGKPHKKSTMMHL